MSYRDPHALANCWRSYFNNEIFNVTQDLWKNYHFAGNTGRISVLTTRPYFTAIPNLQWINHSDPRRLITRKPDYEPLIYCGFCNQYATYHEHDCDYNPPWNPYDGYPFDAPSID